LDAQAPAEHNDKIAVFQGMKLGLILILSSLSLLAACTTVQRRSSSTPLPRPKVDRPTTAPVVEQPRPNIQPAVQAPVSTPPKPAAPPAIDLAAERQRLLETDIAFSRASEERGAAQAFYEFLAPQALSLQAGELPIRGRDAIKVQLMTNMRGALIWKPQEAEVSSSADLGFTWGTYVSHNATDGAAGQTIFGKYLTIWKKQPDGSWKVVVDAGNESPSPERRR